MVMILIIDALLLYHFKLQEDKVPTVPPLYLLMQMPLPCNWVNKKQHYTAKNEKQKEGKIASNQTLTKMKQL